MYDRTLKDQALNFAVSGMLWNRSLIMIDKETRTLWSHLLGKGMRGPHKDVELDIISSVMTDWGSWEKNYPESTALNLSRTAGRFRADALRGPERYVLGMHLASESRAWPYDDLVKQPVVNDVLAETPMLIVFDPKTMSAFSFERKLKDLELTFAWKNGELIDRETGSTWNHVTGEAVDGQRKGMKLVPALGIPSFRKAWRVFYPASTYWRAPDE